MYLALCLNSDRTGIGGGGGCGGCGNVGGDGGFSGVRDGGYGGGGGEYDDNICQVNKEKYTKTPAVQGFFFVLQLWSMPENFF